jgi:hypothetical protein
MISEHSIIALAVRGGVTQQLKVINANIGIDQTWAPYSQVHLDVESENDYDSYFYGGDYSKTLEQTDPYYNTRVQIYLQESFGSSKPISYLTGLYTGKTLGQVSTIWSGLKLGDLTALWYVPWNGSVIDNRRRFFNLKVRSATVDLATQRIGLDLASDESLLQDYALLDTQPYAPAKLTAKTAVEFALGKIGAYLQSGASDATITADASVWEPGDDAWGYVQSLLDAAQLRLYCDEQRRWYLTTSYITGVTRSIAYGTDYVGVNQTTTLDGEFYSAAVVKYTWTDDAGIQQVAYDTYKNARYNYTRVKRVEYNRRYPGPGAAQAIVNRKDLQTVTRVVTMVNDYRFTPGDTLNFTDDKCYPPARQNIPSGRVVGVNWSLPNDTMSITTKLPHYVAAAGPSGGGGSNGWYNDVGQGNTEMGG